MRVIAGKARHLNLVTIEGMDTRPTTDRIKETLFNILAPELYGASVLDLFAGSGALGIEAVSRGAASCVFVEKAPAAVTCIKKNLKLTKLEDQAKVITSDVVSAIRRLSGTGAEFDLILMDPPYRKGLELDALAALKDSTLLKPETLLVVEASLDTDLSEAEALGYRIRRVKDYKTNRHFFLEPVSGEASENE